MLWAYRDRILDLKKDVRLRYILIFKIMGRRRRHPGAQSFATDRAPRSSPTSVLEEIDGCRQHFQQKNAASIDIILRQESSEGARVVLENPEFLYRALRRTVPP